jgi:hypothetical protein
VASTPTESPDESNVDCRFGLEAGRDDRARGQVVPQRGEGRERERDRLELRKSSASDVDPPERQEDGEQRRDLQHDACDPEQS